MEAAAEVVESTSRRWKRSWRKGGSISGARRTTITKSEGNAQEVPNEAEINRTGQERRWGGIIWTGCANYCVGLCGP